MDFGLPPSCYRNMPFCVYLKGISIFRSSANDLAIWLSGQVHSYPQILWVDGLIILKILTNKFLAIQENSYNLQFNYGFKNTNNNFILTFLIIF